MRSVGNEPLLSQTSQKKMAIAFGNMRLTGDLEESGGSESLTRTVGKEEERVNLVV